MLTLIYELAVYPRQPKTAISNGNRHPLNLTTLTQNTLNQCVKCHHHKTHIPKAYTHCIRLPRIHLSAISKGDIFVFLMFLKFEL